MSKIGQELEKRLDGNKYQAYEALKIIQRISANEGRGFDPLMILRTIHRTADEVLAEIKGKGLAPH